MYISNTLKSNLNIKLCNVLSFANIKTNLKSKMFKLKVKKYKYMLLIFNTFQI